MIEKEDLTRIDIHVHNEEVEQKLDQVLEMLTGLVAQGAEMSNELGDLELEVARNTTVEGSALTLIQGFAAQLAAAGTDPVKLKALRDTLATNDDALAAAVTANTPAAPPA